MMVHDPRLGGLKRAERFFSLLRKERISNEFVLELFFPAGDDFFELVQDSVEKWSAELTLETPNEQLRRIDRLKFPVPNSEVEATICSALSHDCRKLDLFFMVGIPHQTYDDVMATVPYCESLIQRFGADPRLQFFISPMGPFLDPGCEAYENPRYGYRQFYRSVEEHREALHQPTWKLILSYETDVMKRDQIFGASYDVGAALNELKFRYGLIDSAKYRETASHQQTARKTMQEIERALMLPEVDRMEAFSEIREKVRETNVDSRLRRKDFEWHGANGLRVSTALVRSLALGLMDEMIYSLHRLAGSYDTAVYGGERMPVETAHP